MIDEKLFTKPKICAIMYVTIYFYKAAGGNSDDNG